MTIRLEEEEDRLFVEELTREAFWNKYAPGCDEHLLVRNLRHTAAFIRELDFVAVCQGAIVGHSLCVKSAVKTSEAEYPAVTLGPLSVAPAYQNRGIGGRLIAHTGEAARGMGYKAIMLYGDPAYYTRFGFKVSKAYGITDRDRRYPAALLALALYEGALDGASGAFFDGNEELYAVDRKELEEFERRFPHKEKAAAKTQERFNQLAGSFL
jgi:predicted N-acetyltransferase YhbS